MHVFPMLHVSSCPGEGIRQRARPRPSMSARSMQTHQPLWDEGSGLWSSQRTIFLLLSPPLLCEPMRTCACTRTHTLDVAIESPNVAALELRLPEPWPARPMNTGVHKTRENSRSEAHEDRTSASTGPQPGISTKHTHVLLPNTPVPFS